MWGFLTNNEFGFGTVTILIIEWKIVMESINIICTDIGTTEMKNQDSACIKRAKTSIGTITMAVVCDGVNGMSQGEMASAIIVQKFSNWFLNELPEILEKHIVDLEERLWKDIIQAVKASWKENLQEAHQSVALYNLQGTIIVKRKILRKECFWQM